MNTTVDSDNDLGWGVRKVACPQKFRSRIIGPNGRTIQLLCKKHHVEVFVPSKASVDEFVVIKGIKGSTLQNVLDAQTEIELIIRLRNVTHFVSIPCNTDEIKANFVKFRDSVSHLDPKLFEKPVKLHISLSYVAIQDETDKSKAAEVLNECKTAIIDPILRRGPLTVKISGVKVLSGVPSAAHVLAANVKSDHLQEIADKIATLFVDRGLSRMTNDNVMLHMTLINSRFLEKSEFTGEATGDWPKSQRKPFDVREIVKNFKDFHFGTLNVAEIHLSKMSAEDGCYYESSAVIKL